jgi:hypothetical protein
LRIGLGYQPQTRLEILDRVRNNPELAPKYEQIERVLSLLDAVLYAERTLTREETEALVRQLPEHGSQAPHGILHSPAAGQPGVQAARALLEISRSLS